MSAKSRPVRRDRLAVAMFLVVLEFGALDSSPTVLTFYAGTPEDPALVPEVDEFPVLRVHALVASAQMSVAPHQVVTAQECRYEALINLQYL